MATSEDATEIQNSVINKQPTLRLSNRWKGKWQPNQEIVSNGNTVQHDPNRSAEDDAISTNTDCGYASDLEPHSERSLMEELRYIFSPSCPEMKVEDCPFSQCCVFWGLLFASESKEPKKNSAVLKSSRPLSENGFSDSLLNANAPYDQSMNSIHSTDDNTTSSTLTEIEGSATRVSSDVLLPQPGQPVPPYITNNPRYSMENLQMNVMNETTTDEKPKHEVYHSPTLV